MRRYFDLGSILVIAITFLLFTLALFLKGLSHDLLLEAGVFLVSVKLIVMSYKNAVMEEKIRDQLASIQNLVERAVSGQNQAK